MTDFDQRDGVTLKVYFDSRCEDIIRANKRDIDALDAKMTLINRMTELAVKKAEMTVDTRLEGMNEFRTAMKDQAARFQTKTEIDITVNSLSDRIKNLELSSAKLAGAASQKDVIIFGGISILSFILTAIKFFS